MAVQYQDKDFGTVHITVNPRAHRFIMRPMVGGLRVTVPYAYRVTLGDVKEIVDKHRTALLRNWQKVNSRPAMTNDDIERLRHYAKQYLPRRVAELAK